MAKVAPGDLYIIRDCCICTGYCWVSVKLYEELSGNVTPSHWERGAQFKTGDIAKVLRADKYGVDLLVSGIVLPSMSLDFLDDCRPVPKGELTDALYF
jgi:hypothetical protein